MTNSKKRLFTVLAVAIVLCISIVALTACNTDSVVKFMVQDENGEWQVVSSPTVGKEGTVSAPTAPAKDYYEFVNWYTDENFTSLFSGEGIKGNMNVYGKYAPIETTVVMDGVVLGSKNLIDVKNNNAGVVAKEGLTFDGWYKDAACQVKWQDEEDVQVLYARSMAKLTFNNGYENIAETLVPVNSIYSNPSEQTVIVDGKEVSLISTMVKPYMSPVGIDYVDDNGKNINFTNPVTKNMTINVKWNSKFKNGSYQLNPRTGNYYLNLTTDLTFDDEIINEIVSIRSTAVILGENDVPKRIDVEAVVVNAGMNFMPSTVKKIVIEEGIKEIKGLNGEGACAIEEVVLPNSIKVIDASFNNMPNLKNVNIPDGVEIIIGSFFKTSSTDYKTYAYGTPYDFEINIPASVKNMAVVPNNFKFAEGSKFSKDAKNGCIYLDKAMYKPGENSWDPPVYLGQKKILVSDPQAYAKFDKNGMAVADTIVVPACEGIQVGTYSMSYDYLILPAGFNYINYNESLAAYDYYSYLEASQYSVSNNMLYVESAKAEPSSAMGPQAYSISNSLGGYKSYQATSTSHAGKVIFKENKKPAELDKFAFVGDLQGFAVSNGKYVSMEDKTIGKNVVYEDGVNKVYISSTIDWVIHAPENVQWGEPEFMPQTSNAVVEYTEGALDKDSVIAKLVPAYKSAYMASFPDFQTKLTNNISDPSTVVKFFADGKEINLSDVKYDKDMFISVEIVMPELQMEMPA